MVGSCWLITYLPSWLVHSLCCFECEEWVEQQRCQANQQLKFERLWFKKPIILFSSVAQSCLTLCDPMNHRMPGLPIYHQLLEFTQTHVYQVGDAIQLSHPLSSPSPPAPNPSQHQSFPMSQLFAWGGQSIGVSASASVLPMNTPDWSPLGWTGWVSLQSKYC